MDAEMADVKNHHINPKEEEEEVVLHDDEHMDDAEASADAAAAAAAADEQDPQHYDDQHHHHQYDENYAHQYEEEGEEGVEVEAGEGENLYDDPHAEYEQGADGVAFEVAVDAAAAVASAAAAHVDHEGGEDEYVDQQEYADHAHHDAYLDESSQQYAEHPEYDQTLAAHPATSREMESMVVDNDGAISSEVAQAVGRYDYAPDGLQTLAATSSAITPHGTPSSRPPNAAGATLSAPHSAYSQKPMMPKFNRSRNWSTEETKILLVELDRISADHPEERRETVLRSHATFEEIAQILRDRGYTNRDGQGCMIRWRNLLRVYKQIRAATAEGNPPSNHPNMQYAPSIESIYRFPPDSLTFMHHEGSPIAEGSPSGGQTRTWAAVNGYETPARKRAREMNMVTEHIDSIDQKIDQTMEYLSQQNEILRSLEERLSRTEDALKSSEAALEILNSTVGEKDTKREELQKQLMVTVQALSQVIAVKKAEQQQQQQ